MMLARSQTNRRNPIRKAAALLAATLVTMAAPAAASRIEVAANAGHYLRFPNGELSNQTVSTDQRSIYNLLPVPGGYQGDLVRRDNGVLTYAGPGSTDTRWTISASEPESTARAYGDLRTGKVGAFAGTSASGYSTASAIISENLLFNIAGADADTITPVRFLVSLHAAAADAHSLFRFRADYGQFTVVGDFDRPYFTETTAWSAARTWVEGTTRYADLTYNLRGANQLLTVEMTLQAIAFLGKTSDFYHTGGLQIMAPQGTTFTSQSGVFLTANGVPEPASWAMLIAGFGLVGGMARRRGASTFSA